MDDMEQTVAWTDEMEGFTAAKNPNKQRHTCEPFCPYCHGAGRTIMGSRNGHGLFAVDCQYYGRGGRTPEIAAGSPEPWEAATILRSRLLK